MRAISGAMGIINMSAATGSFCMTRVAQAKITKAYKMASKMP